MSEIIRTVKKKDIVTSILHIFFNLAVAGGSLALVLLFPNSPWPAIALVVLSKYRVFAVKPRFWWPNLLSNLTDFIFCAGMVLLIWGVGTMNLGLTGLIYQAVLTSIYVVWLVFLKPLTKPLPVLIQAGISQFVGLTAVFSVADYLWAPAVVLLCYGVGFASARHVLMLHKEPQHKLLAALWGLIICQLGFLAYHWTIVFQFGWIWIPEISVIIAVLAFVAERYYNSFRVNDGQIKQADVLLPTLFGSIFLLIILIFFSGLINF
jgi:hypothetical protein